MKEVGRDASTDELAELGIEKALLKRVLRVLAATNVIFEAGRDLWKLDGYSTALAESEGVIAGYKYDADVCIPAIMNLPYYLEKIKYRTPTDPAGNFSDRFGTGFWGFMEDLEQGRTFSIVQASVHEMVPPVNLVVSYPVVELLHDFPADFETPLLVDVGGGTGSDLRLCQRALPPPYNTNAKLILQDLPSVIEDAQRKLFLTNIIPMAHDFFTPQPIKGARAYFMNHVLHDWPDAEVCKILMNLRPAMKPGFSKLLLGENEMREERVSTITAALDLCMMALFSAKERTMRDWEVVLGSAGFRIVKVWRDMNTIIEAEAVEGWESG